MSAARTKSKGEIISKPATRWELWMGMNAWYIVGDVGEDSWFQVTETDYLQPTGHPSISDLQKQAAQDAVGELCATRRFSGASRSEIGRIYHTKLARLRQLYPAVSR